MKYLILTLFFLISFVFPVMAEGPFRELDFDKACLAAKEEKKLVLVDFFTTWCGPCKKLDAVTWKDKDVIEWLEKNTVALKIDAEKEVDLAKRYRISAYPTIALIRPDGTEVDQLVGYLEPKTFLINANDSLTGKTTFAKAEEEFTKDNNNPKARAKYARELTRIGKYEEALTHYLWCYDKGTEYDKGYSSVRSSFLVSEIGILGRKYKPAMDALIERRSIAEKKLLNDESETESVLAILEFTAINRALGKAGIEKNLAFYDVLKERKQRKLEAYILDSVLTDLLKAKRYKDIVESAADISNRVEKRIYSYRGLVLFNKGKQDSIPEDVLNSSKKSTITYGEQYFTALLGAGELEQAKKLAQQIISFDSSPETFSSLVKKAEEFSAKDLAKELSEQSSKNTVVEKKTDTQ